MGTGAGTPPVYVFDTALSDLIAPIMQIDTGANFGLNKGSPNPQLYSEPSHRF